MNWKTIRPYIIHTRPVANFTFGLMFIVGVAFSFIVSKPQTINLLFIIGAWFTWNFILNGAILSYNSHYDKDEGDIGFLNNPPPLPKNLHIFALVLFAIGLVISYYINTIFFVSAIIFTIIGIVYSVPPIRLSNIPGADLVANMVLYGFLTPFAGYSIIDQTITLPVVITITIMSVLIGGGHPLTQLYQYEEDKRKNNTNITVVLGKKRGIILSIALCNFAYFATLFFIVINVLPRLLVYLTILPFILGNVYLFNWLKNYKKVDEKKWMYSGYIAGILIELVLVLGFI